MSDDKAPSVHVPRHHQSAPKEHWADKEINKAAEEIRTGQFKPEPAEDDLLQMLSVGVQRGNLPNSPNDIDMGSLDQTELLMRHPRVQEAMEKLDRERLDAKTSQQYLEKSCALFEMNAAAASANRWAGQERWMGRESEEMRIGQVMTPFEFMERLESVIGEGRVFFSRFAVASRVALLVPNEGAKKTVLLAGQKPEDEFLQVATLQYPCSSEWMVMRFDEYGVPTTAKYLGWRTALLALIREGLVTERQAHQAFPVLGGPASAWYREQLFELRSERGVPS
jgi:hypothetical protein